MASNINADPPALLIIAGPNGSGKSSAYESADANFEGRSFWIVNPDRLTARLIEVEELERYEANLAAVRRIESWLNASIDVHKTIGVETVLSTGKYRLLVERAKQLGFELWLVYVVLDTPERNIERVKLRVRKGGHAVPEDKIRERYKRSLEQLPWFLEQADRAWVYDNSGAELRRVGIKRRGRALPQIDAAAPRVLLDALS